MYSGMLLTHRAWEIVKVKIEIKAEDGRGLLDTGHWFTGLLVELVELGELVELIYPCFTTLRRIDWFISLLEQRTFPQKKRRRCLMFQLNTSPYKRLLP